MNRRCVHACIFCFVTLILLLNCASMLFSFKYLFHFYKLQQLNTFTDAKPIEIEIVGQSMMMNTIARRAPTIKTMKMTIRLSRDRRTDIVIEIVTIVMMILSMIDEPIAIESVHRINVIMMMIGKLMVQKNIDRIQMAENRSTKVGNEKIAIDVRQ